MQPGPAAYPVEMVSGPLIVGYLLQWGLFGTLSVQLYLYYLAFPKDKKFIKCLVYGLYIVEVVQTTLVAHDAFAVFGYGFGNLEALTEIHYNWLIIPIMTAIAAFLGHVFYAYRIFKLSKSRIIPAFVICVSLTSTVAAMFDGVDTFLVSDIAQINDRRISISTGIACGGYALCGIVIVICTSYYLMRSKTSFRPTQILVTKLIRLIIEIGSLTAVVALAIFILFFAFHDQDFYVTPGVIISKLYVNTIYMILNSRIRIMGGRDTYTSSADMEVTSTIMRDITAHSMRDAQSILAAVIHEEVSNSDYV